MIRRNARYFTGLIAASVVAVAAPVAYGGGTIELIAGRDINDTTFNLTALSDDGGTALGALTFSSHNPARWTRSGGLQDLGSIAIGEKSNDVARGVSADGSVITGSVHTVNFSEVTIATSTAWRWASGGGMQPMLQGAFANSISGDGHYIVGTAGAYQPYRWSEQGGRQDLGSVAGHPGYPIYVAADANSDGSVIVGSAYDSTLSASIGWRWTASSGTQDLGHAAGESLLTGSQSLRRRICGRREAPHQPRERLPRVPLDRGDRRARPR
jgi:uncharacterized membrane protein